MGNIWGNCLLARFAKIGVLLVAALAGGCAGTIERSPIPSAQVAETASIPDIPGARVWADEAPKDLKVAYKTYLKGVPQLARALRWSMAACRSTSLHSPAAAPTAPLERAC